jgi:hypothetical protein
MNIRLRRCDAIITTFMGRIISHLETASIISRGLESTETAFECVIYDETFQPGGGSFTKGCPMIKAPVFRFSGSHEMSKFLFDCCM